MDGRGDCLLHTPIMKLASEAFHMFMQTSIQTSDNFLPFNFKICEYTVN